MILVAVILDQVVHLAQSRRRTRRVAPPPTTGPCTPALPLPSPGLPMAYQGRGKEHMFAQDRFSGIGTAKDHVQISKWKCDARSRRPPWDLPDTVASDVSRLVSTESKRSRCDA